MTQPSISHADGVPSVFCHSMSAAIRRSRREELEISPKAVLRSA
jgi:hypothetical protein